VIELVSGDITLFVLVPDLVEGLGYVPGYSICDKEQESKKPGEQTRK
jgi:hypothetical protein